MPKVRVEDDFKTGRILDPKDSVTIQMGIQIFLTPSGESFRKTYEFVTEKSTRDVRDNPVYKKLRDRMATLVQKLNAELSQFEADVESYKEQS